ncbi:MAG: ribose-5-phosphate isomerase RpiA [Candidatus Pacebacteria bacterium]|nr:ribose-5-phosphate isomerase RpiA [Candidatus Paceibacterota bacterium]
MTMKLSPDDMKKIAAIEAVKQVEDGMVIGLGTGSTANFMIVELGRRIREDGLKIQSAVATSKATAERAREQKIPLAELNSVFTDPDYLKSIDDEYRQPIDITFDGADEVYWGEEFNDIDLIKGMGGALLQEKIVASASQKLVIMADNSKLVTRIGERSPLPIEVLPFAREWVYWQVLTMTGELRAELGIKISTPQQRMVAGKPFITDHGNVIFDLDLNEIEDLDLMVFDTMLHNLPGVVSTGLFLGMAHQVILVNPEGEIQLLESDYEFE